MIPLARRYCAGALAGLAIAVLAVALHRATAARFDPCADPAQLGTWKRSARNTRFATTSTSVPHPIHCGWRASCLPRFRTGVPCRSASSGWTRRIRSI